MNAILFNKNEKLVGSLFDAIEYFLYSFLYNKNCFLIFYNQTKTYKDKIIQIIKNRYSLYPLNNNFQNNILILSGTELLKQNLNKVLIVDWGSIPYVKAKFRYKKLIVISEFYTEYKKFFFDKSKFNVDYFAEMPFVYKDYNYTMKFLFEFYTPFKTVENNIYINSPNNNIEEDKILKDYLNNNFPNKSILQKNSNNHKENLFEYFDTYLYYHANKYFDPHPRLFHESYFYNKKIVYENPFNIIDGSFFRYNDLQINGLKNRYLSKTDEIIQLLLEN